MESRTTGDNLATAMKCLENAIDTEGYHELDARQQAYLQEALYYLEIVQGKSSQPLQPNVEVPTAGEQR